VGLKFEEHFAGLPRQKGLPLVMKNTIVQKRLPTQVKHTKFKGKNLRETRYVVAPDKQDLHAYFLERENFHAKSWRESKKRREELERE
tara:strand:- start:851 stop:1114 length:264 start_codon:yes stop_codon:yes gene_type:complete